MSPASAVASTSSTCCCSTSGRALQRSCNFRTYQLSPIPNLASQRANVARAFAAKPSRAITAAALRNTPAYTPPIGPASSKQQRLRVIGLISACVEANAVTQGFEELAGRAAMIGFVIALAAEALVPAEGLFGTWDGDALVRFGALALALVAGSAGLAMASKRKMGVQLREAVLTSLTALSGTRGALNVDKAVDYVFDAVLTRRVINTLVDDSDNI